MPFGEPVMKDRRADHLHIYGPFPAITNLVIMLIASKLPREEHLW